MFILPLLLNLSSRKSVFINTRFHEFMHISSVFMWWEKWVSDCISVMRDISRAYHELRESESKKLNSKS